MQTFRRRAEALMDTWRDRPPHLFVGGLEVESDSHVSIAIHDPATGEFLGRCPSGTPRDVARAVQAAARAAKERLPTALPERRRDRLARVARLIEGDADDLMLLHASETGRPVRMVRQADIDAARSAFRYYAGWTTKHSGEVTDLDGARTAYTRWQPDPVVGVVVDDTEPLAALARCAAPALAVGSAVVAVAPESSPFAALRLAQMVHEAGFPPGSFNVVPGGGAAAEALARHPQVASLSFSGAPEEGRRMLVASAKSNLKPVHLDLGGRSTAVVFDDAALRRASRAIVQAGLFSQGLSPWGVQRVLVQRSVYEDVCSTITQHARAVVLGDPLDEHTELGPLPNQKRLENVLGYATLGRREGAHLVAGGERHDDGAARSGRFVKPTVLIECDASFRVFREDARGPLLAVASFADEDEALAILDDLDVGVGVSFWTGDVTRGHRLARSANPGLAWLNDVSPPPPQVPWSRRRLSGQRRGQGRFGLEQHAQPASFIWGES